MGFGGGGGQSQDTYGSGWSLGSSSGRSGGESSSTPTLYNWKDILPPWVIKGQQSAVPWLQSRAEQGLLPQEERDLWGGIKSEIGASGDLATKNLSRQIASSGMNPSSPAATGGYADLAADRMSTTSKAALDFAKMKMGAKDTAIGQMLTALYASQPAAIGNTSRSSQWSTQDSQHQQEQNSMGSSSSGGGK
jgi:hypothetical protein